VHKYYKTAKRLIKKTILTISSHGLLVKLFRNTTSLYSFCFAHCLVCLPRTIGVNDGL